MPRKKYLQKSPPTSEQIPRITESTRAAVRRQYAEAMRELEIRTEECSIGGHKRPNEQGNRCTYCYQTIPSITESETPLKAGIRIYKDTMYGLSKIIEEMREGFGNPKISS